MVLLRLTKSVEGALGAPSHFLNGPFTTHGETAGSDVTTGETLLRKN